MEKAIRKATEGGYKFGFVSTGHTIFEGEKEHYSVACHVTHLLNPLFWQCLGKAEGWEHLICGKCGGKLRKKTSAFNGKRLCIDSNCWDAGLNVESAKYHCKSLIDSLFDGGNVDDFFNNLIK